MENHEKSWKNHGIAISNFVGTLLRVFLGLSVHLLERITYSRQKPEHQRRNFPVSLNAEGKEEE